MGTPSKKVWELVHSLTSIEEQKFYDMVLATKRGRNTQYLALFTALRSQDEFDDAELRKKLAGEKCLGYLHRTKNYLYGKILEFERNTRMDGETRLFDYLDSIKFLFEKRLYHHVYAQVDKALSLAQEIEDFRSHLSILHYQEELIQMSRNWEFYAGNIDDIIREETELRKQDTECFELKKILHMLAGLTRHAPEQGIIALAKTQLAKMGKPLSKTANILVARIKFNIALRAGNYIDCITETDNIIAIFRNSPALLQDYSHLRTFAMAVFYGGNYRMYFDKYEESDELMNLVQSLGNIIEREPVLYHEDRLLHELLISLATFNKLRFHQAITAFNTLPWEIKGKIETTKEIEIIHLSIVGFIYMAKPEKALSLIRQMRSIKPTKTRKDLRDYSRILSIIIRFDLGSLDVIEDEVRATRISFKRKNVNNPFYDDLLKMFSKISRSKSQSEISDAMRNFIAGFSGEQESIWSYMNKYFNIRAWLNSKLEQRELLEVLQEDEGLISPHQK